MTSPYDSLRYGWGLIYALEIEGIPVRWTEAATGASLGAGYTESACLDIDGSGEIGQTVDRDVGLGAGLPLTFRLLDNLPLTGAASAVGTWIRRFSLKTGLMADIAPVTTAIPVTSTAGFPASGTIWLGNEAITYGVGGLDATHFGTGGTPAVRGAFGSLPSNHYKGTVAGVATDLPRWWRGRQARLYAYPVDPTGYCHGDRFEVWRGYISTGPDREGAGWKFEGLALDRRLGEPVVPALTGRVKTMQPSAAVHKSDTVIITVRGWNTAAPPVQIWGFVVTMQPFASYTDGQILTVAEQCAAIEAAWTATAPGALDEIGGLADSAAYYGAITSTPGEFPFTRLALVPAAGTSYVRAWVVLNGKAGNPDPQPWQVTGNAQSIPLWSSSWDLMDPFHVQDFGWQGVPGSKLKPKWTGIAVELDTVDAVAPSTGTITAGDQVAWYTSATTTNGVAMLLGLYVKTGDVPQFAEGTQVELGMSVEGSLPTLMLEVLESSGATNRGNADALAYGQGYALQAPSGTGATSASAAVDEDSFTALPSVPATVAGAGQSFADLFGGSLAIGQQAVVARTWPAMGHLSPTIRLRVVSTASAGGMYVANITDADLIATGGEPVKTLARRTVPNALKVQFRQAGQDGDTITVIDQPAVVEQGRQEITYTVPIGATAPDVTAYAAKAASILLASQTTQAIEVRVPPWIAVDVGDVCRLQLTHWGVWSWSTGSAGYTGPARCIGRQMDPKTCVVTLTLLVDAAPTTSLCPAMLVSAFDVAAAPTYIRVPDRYLPYLQACLSLGANPARLLHYRPGAGTEGAMGSYTYTSVTDLGTGSVELGGISVIGGAVLVSGESYLTTPLTANCTTYQIASTAHTQDGTSWQ